MEPEEKKAWINAINKNNSEKHKSNGTGWLCDLHFSLNDIQNVRGRPKLKKGVIPVNFIVPTNQSVLDSDSNNKLEDTDVEHHCDLQQSCNSCSTLLSERDELKRILFKTEIDFDCEKQNINVQLENQRKICNDQSIEIKHLKEKISILEKVAEKRESEIRMLREQTLGHMNAASVNVKCLYMNYSLAID